MNMLSELYFGRGCVSQSPSESLNFAIRLLENI